MAEGKVIHVDFGSKSSQSDGSHFDDLESPSYFEDLDRPGYLDRRPGRVPTSDHPGSRRAAVERFTGGIICTDCGEQITPSRLKVKPNATRCLDCQSEAEAQGWSAKQYKDPRP